MNYVLIMGGLGNQLFQYTFAKYVEHLMTGRVTLCTGFFDVDTKNTEITKRDYSLNHFNISLPSVKGHFNINSVVSDIGFNAETDIAPNGILFNGYWQDKKFFSRIRDLIRAELTLKPEYITNDLANIVRQMASLDSVAIHVRRKDYLNQYNKDIFYEISIEYYASAVRYISDKLGHPPVLYIFSDDYNYISNNMDNFCGLDTFLMKPRKDYEDLFLMSNAKHHITANSTFGWWGAALSEYSDGITIVPKHWFKDRRDPDLLLSGWTILDNQIQLDKISVIIPVYNVEKYIDICLESIEKQTYDLNNLEIILIDDASTDETSKHLEAFEAKYPNNVLLIKLEENAGQGNARNIGLNHASGKYITFIDSDDCVDVSMLYKVASKIKEYDCDIVECSHIQFCDDNEIIKAENIDPPFFLDLNKPDLRKKLVLLTCSKTAVWGRLYRKEFLDANRLRFVTGMFFEDIPFSGMTMFLASSYCRINEPLYYYRLNDSGTVFSKYRKERVHQEITATERFLEQLYESNMLERTLNDFGFELSTYCTTKAFTDPLALMINSSLKLNELLSEIGYFKEKLLDLFPDAAASYNLSDAYGICTLAKYLLLTPETMTEHVFRDTATGKFMVTICTSENQNICLNVPKIISATGFKHTDYCTINISRRHYELEHLLLTHAICDSNIIITSSGIFRSIDEQEDITNCICRIIHEYPNNLIILLLEDLYFDESDKCLGLFANMMECVAQHKKIIIEVTDDHRYSLLNSLNPSLNLITISL